MYRCVCGLVTELSRFVSYNGMCYHTCTCPAVIPRVVCDEEIPRLERHLLDVTDVHQCLVVDWLI